MADSTIGTEISPTSGAFVGYNAIVKIAGTELSRVQRLTFSVDNNIQQVYVVSSRSPLNLETGMSIKGNVRRILFNTAMLRLAMGVPTIDVPRRTTTYNDLSGLMEDTPVSTPWFGSGGFLKLPAFTIECELNLEDVDASYYSLKLHGVKFDTYEVTIESNSVVLENVSFVAERVEILAIPTSS